MPNPEGNVRTCVLLLIVLCAARRVDAQVWLPERGEGLVTLTYHGLSSDSHLDSNGRPYDKGQISNIGLLAGVEYGLTNLFTLDANVTLIAAKHEGADRLHGPLDTGAYHGTVQDARVALRLGVPASPGGLALTPFVGGIVPTHAYETRGHSAPGRRLRALELGIAAGRDLGPVLPNGYVQGVYSFALVERLGGMRVNRSHVDIEAGYSLTSFMTATLAGAIQRTHGGLLFPLSQHYEGEDLREVQPFHDRIARDNHFLMSSGATVSVSRAVSVYGSVVWTVSGQNTHAVKGFVVGASWSFSPGLTLGSSQPSEVRTRQSPSNQRPAGYGR